HATDSGTPQGGVISPLLANIAFHGMEEALGVRYNNQGNLCSKRALVRYADDFVIFCESQEDAVAARADITEWLKTRGLALSEEKTRIRHLSEGFDFLGFNVRQYRAPRTSRTGWKLLITPSKDAVKKFRAKVRAIWLAHRGASVISVLAALNPLIRGWTNYYRTVVSKATFSKLDSWMFRRALRYAQHTHPNKPWKWRKNRYWGQLKNGSKSLWVFGDKLTGAYLLQLCWVPIVRHVLVRGRSSPDDPALQAYWEARRQKLLQSLPPKWIRLARTQKGLCPACKGTLFGEEPLCASRTGNGPDGGREPSLILRLVHLFCHQQHYGRTGTAC
ncbi:MAG TPA: group II intron maturase-specific domain-containing protein, partial [Tepidisphaeraceae bacterium]|nr:group II intron maturase-specific domain-containing protein [Tepidisphaeraceae bacterium]